jgi:hypothetical protein
VPAVLLHAKKWPERLSSVDQVYLNLHVGISDVVFWIEGFHRLQCLEEIT